MNPTNVSYLIGIDAGTTSIKAILINSQGDFIMSSGQEYKLDSGPDNSCEVDPEVYWKVTCEVIREIILKSKINPAKVTGIAFSSQGETIIIVDSNGNPLRKAIVWLDNRSVKEAKKIEEKFGNQVVMNITGQPEVVPTWPATRILWIKENEPQIFNQIHKFLLVEDYLIFKLTGQFYSEHSLVSSSLYFNITSKDWWNEMLDFLGISSGQLPKLIPSGTKIGNLSALAATETGLTTGTTVVSGAYDQASGAIGSGTLKPGVVSLTVGGCMAMCVTLQNPVFDISLKLPCQCHALADTYFLQPYAQTAGLVLKWFKDEFCKEEIEIAGKQGTDPYNLMLELAAKISPGTDGLIMLPHFMGTGSPQFNPDVKGVFAGVTIGMKKEHFVRAILEAVAFTIEQNLESMRLRGLMINEIRLLGGGAKSQIWNQIIADVTGIPVVTMSQQENASMGAAILAGVGTGIFKDIESACKKCIRINKRFEPENKNYDQYQKIYQKYLSIYKRMEDYW